MIEFEELDAYRNIHVARIHVQCFLVPVAQDAPAIITFLDALRALGFVEGQNLTIVSGRFQVCNESRRIVRFPTQMRRKSLSSVGKIREAPLRGASARLNSKAFFCDIFDSLN